jgi:amino acid transporter
MMPLLNLVILSLSLVFFCILLFIITIYFVTISTKTRQATLQQRSIKRLKLNALSPFQASAQSFAMMSPIMAICLVTPLIASSAGMYVPLSILVAGFGTMLTGRTIAKFSSRITSAGSLHIYVRQSLGPAFGIYCGLLYVFAILFLTIGSAAFLSEFLSVHLSSTILFGIYGNMWFLSPLFFAFTLQISTGIVSVRGAEISTKTLLWITCLSALMCIMLGIVVVSSVHRVGPYNDSVNTTAHVVSDSSADDTNDEKQRQPTNMGQFCKSIVYSLLIFSGYESSTTMSEETKNPKTNIPKAVMWTVVLSSLFYTVASYLLSYGYINGEAWEKDTTGPLITLSKRFMNVEMSHLFFLSVLIDGWAGSIALVNAISRLLYNLSQDGIICYKIGKIHPTYETPYFAVIYTVTGTLIILCIATTCGYSMASIFMFTADCGGVLIQASYFLVMISGYFEFQQHQYETFLGASVPFIAVFGATLGSGISAGYGTAFFIIVSGGISVSGISYWKSEILNPSQKYTKTDDMENVRLLDSPDENFEKDSIIVGSFQSIDLRIN